MDDSKIEDQFAYRFGGYALIGLGVFVLGWGAGIFYWAATI